jgi:hypothetical protein
MHEIDIFRLPSAAQVRAYRDEDYFLTEPGAGPGPSFFRERTIRIVPVNHPVGPLPEACEPDLIICI